MEFKIHPEIQALLPALSADERAGLAAQLESSRHIDCGVVGVIDGERWLIDGHNRNSICEENGYEFPFREVHFGSLDEAKQWVIDNQLGRRNLTDKWRAYYIGKEYLSKKADKGGDRKSGSNDQNDHLIGSTADQIAEERKVSPITVRRDAAFAEAVDRVKETEGPQAAAAILNNETGKTKAQVIEESLTEKQKSIKAYLADHPDDSNRAIGRALDLSEHTVAAVRRKIADSLVPHREPGDDDPGDSGSTTTRPPPTHDKRRKPSKNGKPKFDWNLFDSHFGHVARGPDAIVSAFDGEKKTAEYRECYRLLSDFRKIFESWKNRLTKE